MRKNFTCPAGRIAAVYIVLAGLWVLFSDRWVTMLFGGTELLHSAHTLKGSVFVLLTGALLYGLMRRTFKRLQTVTLEDSLCGLPNRQAFNSELLERCRVGLARHQRFSLTILDVDHFADLNDEQGHGQGDILLALLAEQLTHDLDGWYIARLDGDEFGLLSPINAYPAWTLAKLDSLQRSLTQDSKHTLLNEQSVSAGTSLFPDHGNNSQDLLRHADMALSLAKTQGRDQHIVYHEQLKLDLIERISLLKDLKIACDERAFTLVYQPQWSVSEQRWSGAEVLIRWQHPERGFISPDLFIPLAEKQGLITSITEFVVEQALAELRAAGISRECLPCLSINLSHPVLLNDTVMDQLFTLIQRQGSDRCRIMMEITETAAMEELDATLAAMQRWRHRGIEFSIDDFGTGYSSLARLKQMPITELKIDQSFIQGIPADQNDEVITKAILVLAQTLSLEVIAEGVETEEQADFLAKHGCTTLQGYFFAKPMSVDALRKLLLPK